MKLSRIETNKLIEYFRSKPILKAYIFGSYARGDASEGSHLDLLVELNPEKPIGIEYAQYLLDLEELLSRKVDLVTEKGLSKHVKPFVDRDKKLFYER